jgi:KDO2-lipid IV(A) lauroyltransferase
MEEQNGVAVRQTAADLVARKAFLVTGQHPEGAPVHAPEVGPIKKILGAFHVTGVFWYKFHRWGVATVPSRGGVFTIITVFTSLFFVFLFKIRKAIAKNLVPVLGPAGFFERQLRIWRTMHTFAWCHSERFERLSTDRPFEFTVENMEAWHEVADSGEGFMMLSAHVGNYEVGAMLPSSEEKRRVHLVREREMDPEAQEFVEGLLDGLPDSDLYSWHFEGDEPLHAVPLLHALQRGEIVAAHGDRPRTGARVVEVEMFARPFPIPAGPITLARTARVAILPAYVLREGRRHYRLVFRDPIRVARTRDRDADLREAAQKVASNVEWAIRENPHQWFCFRSVWDDDES